MPCCLLDAKPLHLFQMMMLFLALLRAMEETYTSGTIQRSLHLLEESVKFRYSEVVFMQAYLFPGIIPVDTTVVKP